MREHILKFETPDDWKPMTEAACWTECPFACLTKLGHECIAREAYRKDRLVICPVIRYGGILGKYEGIELSESEERSENDLQRSNQIHSS